MADKVKPIKLTDTATGETYILEFNREAVRFAEARGFSITEVDKFPMTIYDFFFYAFRMHHKNVSREKTDKLIDDGFGGIAGIPEGMLERLVELYAQTFGTLYDEKDNENPRVVVEL